jgi:hypothetical protein
MVTDFRSAIDPANDTTPGLIAATGVPGADATSTPQCPP